MTLLLLEDDLDLGDILSNRLKKEGFEVIWAQTISDAKKVWTEHNIELCILDVSLPDGSGFDFAHSIQGNEELPIIFLTAMNSAENRLRGYELGASEYIPKPFHFKELLLRLRHVVRDHIRVTKFEMGSVLFDPSTHEIIDSNSETRSLNRRESQLLAYLLRAAPKVVSRDELIQGIWSSESEPSQRSIDNLIVRLRQCLGEEQGANIKTVRGHGYSWVGEVKNV